MSSIYSPSLIKQEQQYAYNLSNHHMMPPPPTLSPLTLESSHSISQQHSLSPHSITPNTSLNTLSPDTPSKDPVEQLGKSEIAPLFCYFHNPYLYFLSYLQLHLQLKSSSLLFPIVVLLLSSALTLLLERNTKSYFYCLFRYLLSFSSAMTSTFYLMISFSSGFLSQSR